ncbi:MAG TPA: antibiotic biosynthesis monooxygenase [Pyrinomonadaceae bacterium]|nr:antibiotic biosynthesis monooxygenase [Pyrinomonadaceae bacterium]
MFVALYRWRIKPELETQFIEAWSEVTSYYSLNEHWRGSRLHRGSDGIFYSYAQWESDELRRKAFEKRPDFEAGARMREAIEESFPETVLEIVSDFLIFQEKK